MNKFLDDAETTINVHLQFRYRFVFLPFLHPIFYATKQTNFILPLALYCSLFLQSAPNPTLHNATIGGCLSVQHNKPIATGKTRCLYPRHF